MGLAICWVVLGIDREGRAHVVSAHMTEAGRDRAMAEARAEFEAVQAAPAVLTD